MTLLHYFLVVCCALCAALSLDHWRRIRRDATRRDASYLVWALVWSVFAALLVLFPPPVTQ